MEKIKLSDGTLINITDIEVVHGTLKISTPDHTVEELVALFSDKQKTSLIMILTAANVECGQKIGFTSFAGIRYDADGLKTVELFQPVDDLERRVAIAEGVADGAASVANTATEKAMTLDEQMIVLASTLDSVLTDVIPSLMEV